MSDLADFILACIAKDEERARWCTKVYPPPWTMYDRGWTAYVMADGPNFHHVADLDQKQAPDAEWLGDALEHVARWDPSRVLAECQAKRRIVAEHRTIRGEKWACRTCFRALEFAGPWPCPTLRLLALPYADHPDYRQEWKP